MRSRASLRVRVTAAAVVVTAAALALGGWALLRAIERTQLARIAGDVEDQVEAVVDRLEAGVAPEEAVGRGSAAPGLAVVQVIDERTGEVVDVVPPGPADEPFVVVGPAPAPPEGVVVGDVVVTGREGGGRVEEPLAGPSQTAIPLELRYERVRAGGRDLTVVAASPVTEVTRSLDAVRRSLLLAVPLLLALVGALAWFVTGRALRPVEAIRSEVEAIRHSTLHRRVPEPVGDDEIGRLAVTMNEMLDRLEGAAERQQRFVADASHELRSPVASLRAQLEVARRAGDEAALRQAVTGALVEEARIEALLSDLLVLAAVDEGTAPPSAPVDLAAVAAEEAAAPRRVPVRVTGSGWAEGSAVQLRRVVANLLDNAARHATSSVAVSVDDSRIVVDDDGPGIPEPDRERVFERFTRLDEGRARDTGGAGLGLALVRAVAAAHGGHASIGSSPLGGARVAVTLGRRPPTRPPPGP